MFVKPDKKYNFIYITTNLINNKSYVGFHSTDIIEDKYLGSGKILKKALKKYGRKNFSRRILEYCTNNNWEKQENFWIKKENTFSPVGYNLTYGGEGGYGQKHHESSKKKMSKTKKERGIGVGYNNSRFNYNIYKFENTNTGEIFEGYKYDLAKKIGSGSSALTSVVNGHRPHHKNWILI